MEKQNYSRRTFLKTAGLGAAALSLNNLELFGSEKYKAKIGFQLYTVRKQIENDLAGTMKKIADMGYYGVETFPFPESIPLERAAKVFNEAELEVIGMHCPLPVDKNRDMALKMADAYKCDCVIYAGWPEADKYKDLDTIKHTAEAYNECASFLKTKGIKFGLHNHWWEFEDHGGFSPFNYLLEHFDKNIFFEIDTYWAKAAGQDPVKIVKDFGKRAPLLHIKDGPAVKGDKRNEQLPLGKGVMDIPGIVKAGGDNTKWMVVEFDDYNGDIFEGMQTSYTYLIKNKLAKGKV
jgi:sugar phosphate isomerase/epimerase